MYIDVEFEDGTVTHIPVSNSHEVRVVGSDGHTQDAFAIAGVKTITLDFAGAPDATQPTPVPQGAAEGPTVTQIAPPESEQQPEPDAPTMDSSADPSAGQPLEHDAVVDQAAAIVADLAPVAAGDQTAQDTDAAKLAQAQTDVDAALEQWPDSTVLADAKAQLAQLAEHLAPAQAPPA